MKVLLQSLERKICFSFLLVFFMTLSAYAQENIVFPADAVIDVTKPPYNADNTGLSDATDAVQKALNDYPNKGAIIYLPEGTYLVSKTITWPAGRGNGDEFKNTIIQGQGTYKTIIKLQDNCPGYTDPDHSKEIINTGHDPAQRFRNAIRDLTINSGFGNEGAIGLRFMANNQGGLFNLKIKSGDGNGVTGLDLAYVSENGPMLVKNVEIDGFNCGIKCNAFQNSQTFEHIFLKNQKQCGIENRGQVFSIRDLVSINKVPVINNAGGGVLTLVQAQLTGYGAASGVPAIQNDAVMYARGIRTTGYKNAISNTGGNKLSVTEPSVAEWASHDKISQFNYPASMLNLPIKDTPVIPWDDLNQWEKVSPSNGKNDIAEIQRAIDAGKTTVYFPRGNYLLPGPVYIRGNVRRIIGCEASILLGKAPDAGFIVENGTSPVVEVSRFTGNYVAGNYITQNSNRILVLKNLCNWSIRKNTNTGDLFIEDICANPNGHFEFLGGNVWARQLNPENSGTHIINDGANLWLLGLKTERNGTLIETKNGGKTELLGFFCYDTQPTASEPMFINNESSFSVIGGETDYGKKAYKTLVQETKGGITKNLSGEGLPARTGGHAIPFYVGGEPVGTSSIPPVGPIYIAVKGIKLNKTKISMKSGDTFQLSAILRPSNSTNQYIAWSSNEPGVVSVDASGKVTAKRVGKAIITATNFNQNIAAKCTIGVGNP